MNLKFLLAALLSLIVLAVFLSLGTWQVQRLKWKEALIAEIDAKIGADPVDLPDVPRMKDHQYLPVAVAGAFDPGAVFVLGSTRDFGAGHRVISPYTTENGRRILIDRGFIPVAAGRPEFAGGQAGLTGNLYWPDERDSYTPEDDLVANTWFARDADKLAQHLNTEPVLIVARTPTSNMILTMPITSEGIPNRHLEYVGTWFLLALTWSVMTLTLLWRKKRRNP